MAKAAAKLTASDNKHVTVVETKALLLYVTLKNVKKKQTVGHRLKLPVGIK